MARPRGSTRCETVRLGAVAWRGLGHALQLA